MDRLELLQKAKPILFRYNMVCAIERGTKTQTRRVIKGVSGEDLSDLLDSPYHREHPEVPDAQIIEKLCRARYAVGDILYVRETWNFTPCIECEHDAEGNCARAPVWYEDRDSVGEGCFVYRANYPLPDRLLWKPAIHMPKAAARIFLRVTCVRAERLRDISLQDIYAEGVVKTVEVPGVGESDQMRWEFYNLWDDTVKDAELDRYGWQANPWVWVYEFERIAEGE